MSNVEGKKEVKYINDIPWEFKPQMQTIVDPVVGDCLRASVASLLGVEVDGVPNFNRFGDKAIPLLWNFLRGLDIDLGYVGGGDKFLDDETKNGLFSPCALVVCKSIPFPTVSHLLVFKNGKLFHNPNPDPDKQEIGEITGIFTLRPLVHGTQSNIIT